MNEKTETFSCMRLSGWPMDTGGEAGYLHVADGEIYTSEVFRAEIAEAGPARLHRLGDPYDKYGDPWSDDTSFVQIREVLRSNRKVAS